VLGLSTVTGAIAYAATSGGGGLLAFFVILLTGVVVGWVNGFLYVKGKMPHPFIPTLATLYAARGLALVISDGRPSPGMSHTSLTLVTKENAPEYLKIREKQLGSLLGVED
jgi:ribose transport system permease protein